VTSPTPILPVCGVLLFRALIRVGEIAAAPSGLSGAAAQGVLAVRDRAAPQLPAAAAPAAITALDARLAALEAR
jgi:hypothetical protein